MIIDTNKQYKLNDILDFMSDIISCHISNGSKIDFEQQWYIYTTKYIQCILGDLKGPLFHMNASPKCY